MLHKKSTLFVAIIALVAAAFVLSAATPTLAKEGNLYDGRHKAKYIFYFIGDGLGMPQRTAAEQFTGQRLLMDTFPAQGVTTTYANDRFITGSAASGTALAAGVKTNVNYVGVDPEYNPVETLAEKAKKRGMAVGIVSSVSIDHATPACFYAHQPHRGMYHEIDMDLVNSDFEYFAGGGFKDPKGNKSKKPQGDALEIAKKNGFAVVDNKRDFENFSEGRLIAYNAYLPDGKALPYDMDNSSTDITLAEFTQKGVDLLSRDKDGFFLMVEGGKIDWACHANDAVAAIRDTVAFEDALKVAYDFYKKHPEDTLIVVTGDHECGGLTLGFAGTKYATDFDLLKDQKFSFQVFTDSIVANYKKDKAGNHDFDDLKPVIEQYFGLKFSGDGPMVLEDWEQEELEKAFVKSMAGDEVKSDTPDFLLYGSYDPLTIKITHLLNRKAGLAWTSYSHTGVPVTTSAVGVGCDTFNGYYDNTDVAKKIAAIMGV